MTSQGVLFRPAYFDAVGDVNAALLMSQIHYWYLPDKTGKSKLRVYKRGHWWLVKSHDDWFAECRLTRRQVDRALAILVEAKLVQVEIHRFGGVPTRHIICPQLAAIPLQDRDTFAPISASGCTPMCNPLPALGQSLTETTAETIESSELSEGGAMATAKEILQGIQAGSTKAVGFAAVTIQWKKSMSALLDGGFVKPLTAVEQGQLKHVYRELHEKTVPVLRWAIENWQKFAMEAAAKKGIAAAPQQPVPGFFLQHYEVAVQLIAEAAQKQVVVSAPKIPQAVTQEAPVSVDNSPGSESFASEADIADTLAELEKLNKPS